jgi:DDE superfamily endonuclease
VAVVAFIMSWDQDGDGDGDGAGDGGGPGRLAGFRREVYLSLGKRRDVLSEACDAVLCKPERVLMLAELCLEPECRRGHGGLYDALNSGEVRIGRLRQALSGLRLPAWPDGRIRLGVDVSNWLRPDAATSPERSFCHCYGRGKSSAQMIPGWPYSWVAALEPGRTSWALPLDAVRLRPGGDLAAVTAAQVRGVVTRLIAAGHWADGDPDIMVVIDAGYEPARLAWLLRDLPVQVTGRLGTSRVFRLPPPARRPGQMGRPVRHGPEVRCAAAAARPEPDAETSTVTSRYGTAVASCWNGAHPKLKARGAWEGHQGPLPVIEGTLIRLTVDHLRHERDPKPVWLWTSRPDADPAEADLCWQAYLRRFDLEHMFRFLKQHLGWTRPRLRDPAAADRWTWLIIACYAQLWLARGLAAGLRLPWQQPCQPGRLTPARVRRGFRAIHRTMPVLTAAPKPGRPGPGRPPGQKNRRPATRHDVGKAARQPETSSSAAG